MTRVIVTGATGFIGQRVCQRLVAGGHEVVAVTRDAQASVKAAVARRVSVGDIGEATGWSQLFAADDTVVHLAARAHQGDDAVARDAFQQINVEGTRRLVDAALPARVAHIVFVSSAKVFGERSLPNADGTPHAYTADDATAPAGPYGASKLAAETLLRQRCGESGVSLSMLRPPLVYGPGNKANLRALLRAIDRGWPLPLASIRNCRSLVYVDNLADLIARVIETANGTRVYTVSDIALSTPDLVRALAAGLGRDARLLPCPVVALRLLGHVAGRAQTIARLTDSMVLDSTRVVHELDWQPATGLAQAMRAIGEWYRGDAACR